MWSLLLTVWSEKYVFLWSEKYVFLCVELIYLL